MGTDPAPGGRGPAAPAMGSFQLEDFVAGWIGGEPTQDGREPPEVGVLSGDPSAGESGRERRARRCADRVYTPDSGWAGSSAPTRHARAARAACCRESPAPGGLAVVLVNSASLTKVHLSCRFASKLGSADLDPVMIKPRVQADSQWSAQARTHPSVTGCAPEFGDVACRNLWVRVVLVLWPRARDGELDFVIWF